MQGMQGMSMGMPPMGGGAPMDPMGMAPMPGDPSMIMSGDPMGMPPAGMPPMDGGMPMGSEYPSTDPGFLSQILGLLEGVRSSDHAALQQKQDGVLMMLLQSIGFGGMPQAEAGFSEGGDIPLEAPEGMAQGMI